MTVYGFRFDRDAEGVFYVKQRAQDGNMVALSDVAQDRRRFATWQEAKGPAEKWAADANDPRVLPVCNPMHQERRMDGVAAHLEYDPKHGTVLVRDRDCKDRAELDQLPRRYTAGEAVLTEAEIDRSLREIRNRPEVWTTTVETIDTPRGLRYRGIVYVGEGKPKDGPAPRGAQVRYTTRLHTKYNEAREQARSRTIHHNVFHGGNVGPETMQHHRGRCPERHA